MVAAALWRRAVLGTQARVAQSHCVLLAIDGVTFEDASGSFGWIGLASFFELHFETVDIGCIDGTVLQDDPQLTVRDVQTPRQPQRIVVDRHAQTPLAARILQGGPVWIFTADSPRNPFPANVEAIAIPDANRRVDLAKMMDELGRRRINELHVEAGARLSGALLAQGLVDELLLYFAPSLLGDTARGMFTFGALTTLDQRLELDIREVTRVGEDWRVIAKVAAAPTTAPAVIR